MTLVLPLAMEPERLRKGKFKGRRWCQVLWVRKERCLWDYKGRDSVRQRWAFQKGEHEKTDLRSKT